ncbi:MAG: hypothetical protein AABZ12_02680 [Planctomycetota bacterium]
MPLQPNLGRGMRIGYAALGVVLAVGPLIVDVGDVLGIVAPVCGVLAMAAGGTGY